MTKRKNELFVDKQGDEYVISMTPEMQDDVGTVGFVEFVDKDDVKEGDTLANIEASKTVLDVLSPLAGRIVARHEEAEKNPELLNSSKQEESWIVRLGDVSEEEYNKLEDA